MAIGKTGRTRAASTMATLEYNVSLPLHADRTAVGFLQLLQPCLKLSMVLAASAGSYPACDLYATFKATLHAPTALRAVQLMATGLEAHIGISFKANLANAMA